MSNLEAQTDRPASQVGRVQTRLAGDFTIDQLILLSDNINVPVDIASIVHTIHLFEDVTKPYFCLLYTSPSPRDS